MQAAEHGVCLVSTWAASVCILRSVVHAGQGAAVQTLLSMQVQNPRLCGPLVSLEGELAEPG